MLQYFKDLIKNEMFRTALSSVMFVLALAFLLCAIGVDELVVCKLDQPFGNGIDKGVFTFHSSLLTDGKRDMLSRYKVEVGVSYEGSEHGFVDNGEILAMGGVLPNYALASYILLMSSAFFIVLTLVVHLKHAEKKTFVLKMLGWLTFLTTCLGAIMATLPVTMATPTEMPKFGGPTVFGTTECQMGLTGTFAWVTFSLWTLLGFFLFLTKEM